MIGSICLAVSLEYSCASTAAGKCGSRCLQAHICLGLGKRERDTNFGSKNFVTYIFCSFGSGYILRLPALLPHFVQIRNHFEFSAPAYWG